MILATTHFVNKKQTRIRSYRQIAMWVIHIEANKTKPQIQVDFSSLFKSEFSSLSTLTSGISVSKMQKEKTQTLFRGTPSQKLALIVKFFNG